jgi:hypothetical protein
MFNNNLPDIILPDDKNIGDHSSTPASLSSSSISTSTQTPPSASSSTVTTVSKSSNDAYYDLKEIAFPNQIHRSFSDIVSKLSMYVYTYLHIYPFQDITYPSRLSIYNLYIIFNVCLIIVPIVDDDDDDDDVDNRKGLIVRSPPSPSSTSLLSPPS